MKSHAEAVARIKRRPKHEPELRVRFCAADLEPGPAFNAPALNALTVIVEGPPQPWQRAGRGNGRTFTREATRQYQRAVRDAAHWALPMALCNPWPLGNLYRVTIRAYFADARRRDADNVAKSCCDALNGVLWVDDSQVVDLMVSRRVDRARPRTEIRIERIA